MSRESALKATAAGLQPKSLDLTQLAPARVATRVASTRRVSNEDAAYALGFSVADLVLDGELIRGAPLAALLLRMKYADQMTAQNFAQAHALLLDHYGGTPTKPWIMGAVARAALVEWLLDRCPKCRGAEGGQAKARRCTCMPKDGRTEIGEPYRDPQGAVYLDREGAPLVRSWNTTQPERGCPKCAGLGRIFGVPKERRGIRCLSCRSSGRLSYKHRRRYRLVSAFLLARNGIKNFQPKNFSEYWDQKYRHFLSALRATDRQMGAGLDFGYRPSENRAIGVVPEEKLDDEQAERSDVIAVGQTSEHEPEEPTGELPPLNS